MTADDLAIDGTGRTEGTLYLYPPIQTDIIWSLFFRLNC